MDYETRTIEFEIPKGYEQVKSDKQVMANICPKCGEAALQPHPSKPLAKCHECEIEYRVKKRSATFVQPVSEDVIDNSEES